MAKKIYIAGGVRNDKSTFSEKRTREFGESLGYIATAQTSDDEKTVQKCQECLQNPEGWITDHLQGRIKVT